MEDGEGGGDEKGAGAGMAVAVAVEMGGTGIEAKSGEKVTDLSDNAQCFASKSTFNAKAWPPPIPAKTIAGTASKTPRGREFMAT